MAKVILLSAKALWRKGKHEQVLQQLFFFPIPVHVSKTRELESIFLDFLFCELKYSLVRHHHNFTKVVSSSPTVVLIVTHWSYFLWEAGDDHALFH